MRIRTGYSFHTAAGSLEDVVSRLQEIGATHAPISDRTFTFAFTLWSKITKKVDLKPVYGVELAVSTAFGTTHPVQDYWSFFAIDQLVDINTLVWTATTNPCSSRHDPSLSYEQALNSKGTIIVAGERLLIDHLPPFLPDHFYMALSPATPKGLLKLAADREIPLIASSENYYPRKQDLEFYRVALGRRAFMQSYPRHILTDAEWRTEVSQIASDAQMDSALANRAKALEMCQAKLLQADLFKPAVDVSLREMCIQGAAKKAVNLNDPIYSARLDKELKLISEKKFEDYFFIIADMIQYAKKHMMVGPARGSSCGSLVCFLLDITAIDPIKFDLIFERFIDTTRKDLPDIDIDFSDEKRFMVFEYADTKYGKAHVSRLGTTNTFKPRNALKGAGAALHIPAWKTEKVLENLVTRAAGDERAKMVLEDTLNDTTAGRKLKEEFPEIEIATRMEGHAANAGQHAAGLIITSEPILKYVAIDGRNNCAMCDKYDAESLNLLKIDALGLTQLSIFERAAELAGIKNPLRFFESLPLDDAGAFEVLNKHHFSGVFQFMGPALQQLSKRVNLNHVEDLISITALARPGPMASGGAESWVKRRTGQEAPSYYHPLFEPYLKNTLGIVIYQEQIMQITRDIGDMSWEDVTALRKAMSKTLGKETFDKFGNRWKAGAIKKGIDIYTANKVWDDLCTFGAYGFNRAHAVAYGVVSYWCCWMKAHFPIEFAAAALDAQSDTMRMLHLLRELDEEGIKYVPIDRDHSAEKWTVADDKLVGPLTLVKGIGPVSMRKIIDSRITKKPLEGALRKKLENAVTAIDTLSPVHDRIKKIHPDLTLLNIYNEPRPIKNVQCGINGNVLVFGVAKTIAEHDENEPAKIEKRGGYEIRNGPTKSINMFLADDTDEIFVKIGRYQFERLSGQKIIDEGRPKKSLYAIVGKVPEKFRMIDVSMIRYLGELEP